MELFTLQRNLIATPSILLMEWAKQFIVRFLHTSYGQWIFHNAFLHIMPHRVIYNMQGKENTLDIDDHLSCLPQTL